MRKSSTKPKGATSFKETAFGIIPRRSLIKLEIEGTKRGFEKLYSLLKLGTKTEITPDLFVNYMQCVFGGFFLNGRENIGQFQSCIREKKRQNLLKFLN